MLGETPKEKLEEYPTLWNADPKCHHVLIHPVGGGVKCKNCNGWYCY